MLKIIDIKNHILKNKLLYLVFSIAFLLRVIKIDHGYPYIFNIDEPAIVRTAFGLRQGFRIDHFDWPHFPFYFNYAFYFIFIKFRALIQILGMQNFLEGIFPILWNDPFVFYFISRLLSAVLGALTLFPVYLLGKALFSRQVGIISSMLLAFIPYHIYSSKLALADVAVLFFLSYAIYYSYKFSETLKVKDIIIAAALYGISSGIKYNAILLSLTLIIFTFIRLKADNNFNIKYISRNIFPKFIVFGIISLITLLATTPSIITDWDIFWSYEGGRGFLWQLFVNSSPIDANEYLPALVERIYMVAIDMAVIPFVLFIISAIFVFIRPKREDSNENLKLMAIVLPAILFFLFTNRYSRSTSHYFLPIYGLMVISAAYVVSRINAKIGKSYVLSIVLLLPVIWSIYTVLLFLRGDTRNIALNYYEEARSENSDVYYEGESLAAAQSINNTGMKQFRRDSNLHPGDLLLTEKMHENDDKIMLIETIDNSFRRGPILYVYKKSI